MHMTGRFLIVAVLTVIAPFAFAQVPPEESGEEKAERIVEPAAQKLIDAAKAKLYSATGAGLTEMTCVVSFTHPSLGNVPVKYSVTFSAPRSAAVELQPLPQELAAYAEVLVPQLKKQGGMVANMFGETCSGLFSDTDKYNLAMKEGAPDIVVQTKFAADAALEKSEVTFGESGLPTKMLHVTEQGPVTITPTFETKDEKFLLTRADIATPANTMKLTMTHERVGGFWLVSKVEISNPSGAMEMKASDIKVKQGE